MNVNIAATTVEEYRMLKEAGIGTYILFQETYHKESYEKLHPTGPKHNYDYHTEAMDRAMDGGIDDVGLGVLFGLENYPLRVGRASDARRASGSCPRRWSSHHQRSPHQTGRGHRPRRFRQRHQRRYFRQDLCPHSHCCPLHRHDHFHTGKSGSTGTRCFTLGISQISGGSRTSVGGYDDTGNTG